MVGTIDIHVNAARPNMPLAPIFQFRNSPSSLRLIDLPKAIGNWSITRVYLEVKAPDNYTQEVDCVRTGNVWVGTFMGCAIAGKSTKGISVMADGVDENNQAVQGYCLGKGDLVVLDGDADIARLVEKYEVRYLTELPTTPTIGDLVNYNGQVKIFDGTKWVALGGGGGEVFVFDSPITIQANGTDVGTFTTNQPTASSIDIPVPSATSDLANDSGFITAEAIPTNVSAFENDAGYVTASELPPIPSKVSELENDSGYITQAFAAQNFSKTIMRVWAD